MTLFRLERFGHDIDATWGRLSCFGYEDHFFTVEPPWNYNRRFESCVPDGSYDLVRHDSQKYAGSWALVGDGVSQKEEPGIARFACLIHATNWARQLDGCIAPGSSIQDFGRAPGVAGSRPALDRIDEILSAATNPGIEILSMGR